MTDFRAQPGPQTEYFLNPADICIYGGAAGGGKAIKLDTVLPTPDGWVSMGDIQNGQALFDESGKICFVTSVFDIIEFPELYRLTFDDGSIIDACKDHIWKTYTAKDLNALTRLDDEWRAKRRERRQSRAAGNKSEKFTLLLIERNKTINRPPIKPAPEGSLKTTLEIFNTLTTGKNKRKNHAIKVTDALDLPEIKLPLDPYLLGLWLGDGTRGTGSITTADEELTNGWIRIPSSLYGWRVPGLSKKLKDLDIIKNKHIPETYLRASREQRLDLLKGLMDTDGTVNKSSGAAEFDNTDENLTDTVIELACSLGHKPGRKTKTQGKLNGKIYKDVFSVKWTPPEYVFRLKRKKELQILSKRRTTQFRYIVKAELIESSPARCISVSSSSGLFLASERMIPTHNSFALLLDPIRRIHIKGFTSTIFRRTYPEIQNEGGLWDDSENIYPFKGGVPRESDLSWYFPKFSNSIKFSHMEHEKTKFNYQGSQICYLAFDELTHFSESQFFYMLSRNRSVCGLKPYVRATCNPDAESWVAELIAYWIDQDTGYPIPERSGVLRWFIKNGDSIFWADSKAELRIQTEGLIPDKDFLPKSLTFIPASLDDNPALLEKDPGYRGNLLALSFVDRERLLGGNWKIRHSAGNMFRTPWFKFIYTEELPAPINKMNRVRWWDTAATEPSPENKDPDWSAGVLLAEYEGRFYVLDLQHFRKTPAQTEAHFLATAEIDGRDILIGMEQEPGSAGKREIDRFKTTTFKGYNFRGETSSGDKVTRAKPLSAAAENSLIYVIRAPWNYEFMSDLTHFPDPKFHDDIVDACSAAFEYLNRKGPRGPIDLSKIVRGSNEKIRGITLR